jgi:hypothetical protein
MEENMNAGDDKELIGYAESKEMKWREFRPGSRRKILRHDTRSLKEAGAAGHDLEALFNHPDYHLTPSGEITDLINGYGDDSVVNAIFDSNRSGRELNWYSIASFRSRKKWILSTIPNEESRISGFMRSSS